MVHSFQPEEGTHLIQGVGLEFHLHPRVVLAKGVDARLDGCELALGGEMVVLDHRAVVEPHAMIAATAIHYRRLLQHPPAGRRLAGIKDGRARPAHGLYERRGQSGDAAQSLGEVECATLCREDGPGLPRHLDDGRPIDSRRRDARSGSQEDLDIQGGIHRGEDLRGRFHSR